LDDPTSDVSRMCLEYSRVTRLMFDPDGPMIGEPDVMKPDAMMED